MIDKKHSQRHKNTVSNTKTQSVTQNIVSDTKIQSVTQKHSYRHKIKVIDTKTQLQTLKYIDRHKNIVTETKLVTDAQKQHADKNNFPYTKICINKKS